MEYNLLYSKTKRPNNSAKQLKEELLHYLKEEFKKQHIPSRREIEKNFHIRLSRISKNITSLYEEAGLIYKLIQNQSIKATKAELLLNIILNNLQKFELKLISFRNVHERGVDIITKKEDKTIGIEIKAYNKNEKLKGRDITQVKRFIEKEKLNGIIIITTTDLQDKKLMLPSDITLIKFEDLKKILSLEEIKNIEYIRNYSVNIEDALKKEKRQKILNYVVERYKKENKKPRYNEILKQLHLDIYTYFDNLFEIYKILKIPPPVGGMNGKNSKIPDKESINLWKEEFKKYILEEIKKGHKYPSGEEIGKHFGISSIWNIVNVSDLYRELNLKTYAERRQLHIF